MKTSIVVVAYNRVHSLKRLLDSLLHINYSSDKLDMIISIDKSNTDVVEKYADSYTWPFGKLIVDKKNSNLGLQQHMMSLGKWFDEYDSLIVLEDDIVVSPAFYSYAKQTINTYKNNNKIAGISLYSFPLNQFANLPFEPYKSNSDVYFINFAMSWGQIWMKNQWLDFYEWYKNNIDFKESLDIPKTLFRWKKSWLKYHSRYCIEQDKYFVYPYYSFSTNCGEIGVHSKNKSYSNYQVVMQMSLDRDLILPSDFNKKICYDGFFENKAIYDSLGLNSENCCIDLNGSKQSNFEKRYYLTCERLPYKVVRSFGLSFHPIECNIFNSTPGRDIFLYDTTRKAERPMSRGRASLYIYEYRINSMLMLNRIYGLKNLFYDFFHKYVKGH